MFVYEFNPLMNNWTQLGDIIVNDDCDQQFGHSLAITEDGGLAIGCLGKDSFSGAVYFYVRPDMGGQYMMQQKIVA